MARITNPKEYADRRNEILDVAQRLIYTKGFRQMSIQDILDQMQISKGAFYHYFSSKQDLLEAMVGRTQQIGFQIMEPVIQDHELPALLKLQKLFDTIGKWKSEQKGYMMEVLRIWYTDDNLLVREKLVKSSACAFAQALAQIIQEGIQQGVMDTANPEIMGDLVVNMMIIMGDKMAETLLALTPDRTEEERQVSLKQLIETTELYTRAIERVIGAKSGSIELVSADLMAEWVSV